MNGKKVLTQVQQKDRVESCELTDMPQRGYPGKYADDIVNICLQPIGVNADLNSKANSVYLSIDAHTCGPIVSIPIIEKRLAMSVNVGRSSPGPDLYWSRPLM